MPLSYMSPPLSPPPSIPPSSAPSCALTSCQTLRHIILIDSHGFPGITHLQVSDIEYKPLEPYLTPLLPSLSAPSSTNNALLFTSKHAIYALLHTLKAYPHLAPFASLPAFVIGEACASLLHQHNMPIAFISKHSHSKGFAQELQAYVSYHFFYMRAEVIASSLDTLLLQAHIALTQIIAYRTILRPLPPSKKPPHHAILIFTAPSNYHFFMQNFGWDDSYIAIAIGPTTYQHFAPSINKYMSEKRSIRSCIELAKTLANHDIT